MRKPLKYRYLREYDGRPGRVYEETTFYDSGPRSSAFAAMRLRRDKSAFVAVRLRRDNEVAERRRAARTPRAADIGANVAMTNGTAVATRINVRPFFMAWLLLALLLFVMGLGQQTFGRQNASSRAMAAPTRLSGVEAPDVKPTVRGPAGGSHPVAVTSLLDPTG